MRQDVYSKLLSDPSLNYEEARVNMLKQQIRTWQVDDPRILNLYLTIPREDFVPPAYRSLAFAETGIPLPDGQMMMAPREEAKILQTLNITKKDNVLLLGTDSGYFLTLLAKLGKHVFYVNNDLSNVESIQKKIEKYALVDVTQRIGDLHAGWHDLTPFDVILLTGSLFSVPDSLKNVLALQGRLFVVIGNPPIMEAMIVTRTNENTWREQKLFETYLPRLVDVKEQSSFVF